MALRVGAGAVVEARDDPAPGDHPGHATRLLAMADGLLQGAPGGWDALERVAVGIGPGRFTGLRVGLATARGLAHALGCELAGVSSLRALAAGALAAGEGGGRGAPDAVLAVIDARRGEVFAAAYAAAADAGPRELSEPVVLAPERWARCERARAATGAPRGRWPAVGDGALCYRAALECAGIELAPAGSPAHPAVRARGLRARRTRSAGGRPRRGAAPVPPPARRGASLVGRRRERASGA